MQVRHAYLRLLTLTLLAAVILAFSGCGGKSAVKSRHKSSSVVKTLAEQYASWKGVRYKMGGLSKKGVDCSGFVYLTFKKCFGRTIPRSTKLLAQYGSGIKRSSLRPGDLVFFKTGIKIRHVGIYYKNNKFIHASTSRGVMISDLSEKYWSKRYWQARRVL